MIHLQFLKLGEIVTSEIWALMLAEEFQDKVTPGIDFTAEAVVQCDVPVVQIQIFR